MQNIRSALRLLEQGGAVIVRQVSPAYENRAIGMGEAADFINVVAELATELSPMQLLHRCLAIESQLGGFDPMPGFRALLIWMCSFMMIMCSRRKH